MSDQSGREVDHISSIFVKITYFIFVQASAIDSEVVHCTVPILNSALVVPADSEGGTDAQGAGVWDALNKVSINVNGLFLV